jgi:hypothetical protein
MSAVPETTAAASAPEQAANALKQRLRRILRNVSGPVKVQLGILANLHAREANIRVDTELQKLEAFLVVHFPTEMENDVDISSDAMVAKITELGTQLVGKRSVQFRFRFVQLAARFWSVSGTWLRYRCRSSLISTV